MTARTILIWLLRFDAFVLSLAFVTIFLSEATMASLHERLGLGPFPATPLVDYLTRSVSLLYAVRGLFLWLAATDVDRFRPFIYLIGATNVLIGLVLLGIDLHAGLPLWWTWVEGPPIALVGLAVLWLARRDARATGTRVESR